MLLQQKIKISFKRKYFRYQNFTDGSLKNVLRFYEQLLMIDGIVLEEGFGKQPLRKLADRIVLTNLQSIQKILLNSERSIRISLEKTNLVVIDFDLHKFINEKDRVEVTKKLLELIKNDNITAIKSPSGGFHFYYDQGDLELSQQIGITLVSSLQNVDILRRGVTGPDFYKRSVVNFNNFSNCIPEYFFP